MYQQRDNVQRHRLLYFFAIRAELQHSSLESRGATHWKPLHLLLNPLSPQTSQVSTAGAGEAGAEAGGDGAGGAS